MPRKTREGGVGGALEAALFYRALDRHALAERIGVSYETVRRWAAEETQMSRDDVELVADALDIPGELLVRPPSTRERALAMIAAWDGMREARGVEPPPA